VETVPLPRVAEDTAKLKPREQKNTTINSSADATGMPFFFGSASQRIGDDTGQGADAVDEKAVVYSGTVICDEDGRIQWIDDALARFLNLESAVWNGDDFDAHFVPHSRSEVPQGWPRTGSAPWNATIAGHPHRVRVRVTALPIGTSNNAQICSIVALDEYVMDRLAAGRARLRSTIGAIVAGFAHEVRNPLASILTLTELAIRELKNSYIPFEGLLRIPTLVDRIERMIRQTLEYGRPPRPTFEIVSADYILKSALRMVEPRSQNVRLVLEPADDISIYADPQQVEQVLCNLLQNAVEADASVVRISRRLDSTGALIHITIADDGSGLSEELVPYMFEPFFTSKAHGTGLGLAIARDLARLNEGDIELTENSRNGATFVLALRSCPKMNERFASEGAKQGA
jgi:signal transduction histidine kinase